MVEVRRPPLLFALAVASLWQGDNWLRWLVGVACILSGAIRLAVGSLVTIRLAEVTPREATGLFLRVAAYPLGLVALPGLVEVLAGLAFLALPSVQAFFRHQRLGRSAGPGEGA